MFAHTAKDIEAIAARYLKENVQLRLDTRNVEGVLHIEVAILLEGQSISTVVAKLPLSPDLQSSDHSHLCCLDD